MLLFSLASPIITHHVILDALSAIDSIDVLALMQPLAEEARLSQRRPGRQKAPKVSFFNNHLTVRLSFHQ